MKKLFALFILIAFTLSAFVGCDLKKEPKEPTSDTTQKKEGDGRVDIDLPKLQEAPHLDFDDFSVWRDENNSQDCRYVYIKAWDVYRKLELSHYPHFDLTSMALGENAATLSIYCSHRHTTEITSYHFDISKEEVASYTVEIQTPTTSEVNEYFINMHSENVGYFFFIPQWESLYDTNYPLIRFETCDGGKTWNRIENVTLGEHRDWHDMISVAKFISHNVGIVDFRTGEIEGRFGGTHLTIDGGLTWNKFPQLPYHVSFHNGIKYQEVSSFEIIDNSYILIIEGCFEGYSQYITFKSDNLTDWVLIDSLKIKGGKKPAAPEPISGIYRQ